MCWADQAQKSKSNTQILADKAAGWLFYVALSVAAITAVAWTIAVGFNVGVIARVEGGGDELAQFEQQANQKGQSVVTTWWSRRVWDDGGKRVLASFCPGGCDPSGESFGY